MKFLLVLTPLFFVQKNQTGYVINSEAHGLESQPQIP